MSTPTPPLTPGPATSAMRLRARTTAEPGPTLADELETLHAALECTTPRMCRSCLMPHPCDTLLLARAHRTENL